MDIVFKYLADLLIFLILIVLLRKRKVLGPKIMYFAAAMLASLICDLVAMLYRQISGEPTVVIYVVGNFLVVFFLLFYYFYQLFEHRVVKNIQMGIVVLSLLNFILSAFFDDTFFSQFPNFTYFINCILLLCTFSLFFYETFNTDNILNIRHYYPFWIVIGLFTIYIGIMPLMLISSRAQALMDVNLFFFILNSINVLGYGILLCGTFFAKKLS